MYFVPLVDRKNVLFPLFSLNDEFHKREDKQSLWISIPKSTDWQRQEWQKKKKKCGPRGVVVSVLDRDIVVSEFELWSLYYIHFRTNITEKIMNSLYSPSYRLNSTTTGLQG